MIARSIATDKFKGKNLVKALAIVGAINGIAPVAAPVLGGVMVNNLGWQGIFVILLFIGLILLGCCAYFHESLSHQRRSSAELSQIFADFYRVLKNRSYLFFALFKLLLQLFCLLILLLRRLLFKSIINFRLWLLVCFLVLMPFLLG